MSRADHRGRASDRAGDRGLSRPCRRDLFRVRDDRGRGGAVGARTTAWRDHVRRQAKRRNGPEAIAVIRRELGSIPVLFITATPNPCQETDPPKDIFSKPMDTRAVSEAFRGYLKAALERRVASARRD